MSAGSNCQALWALHSQSSDDCRDAWENFHKAGGSWKDFKATHPVCGSPDQDPWADFIANHPECAPQGKPAPLSRYVYHASVEPPARPNASGQRQVLQLRGLGLPMRPACPAWGCDGRIPIDGGVYYQWEGFGATNTVPQPAPSSGASLVVGAPTYLPISPAPSPVVAAPTPLSLTNPGQPAAPTDLVSTVQAWLAGSTELAGYNVPNWGFVAAAALLLMNRGGRRR